MVGIDDKRRPALAQIEPCHARRASHQNATLFEAIADLGYLHISFDVSNPDLTRNSNNYGIFHDSFPVPDMLACIRHKICKPGDDTHCTQGQAIQPKEPKDRNGKILKLLKAEKDSRILLFTLYEKLCSPMNFTSQPGRAFQPQKSNPGTLQKTNKKRPGIARPSCTLQISIHYQLTVIQHLLKHLITAASRPDATQLDSQIRITSRGVDTT